jgi:hypothetical protein
MAFDRKLYYKLWAVTHYDKLEREGRCACGKPRVPKLAYCERCRRMQLACYRKKHPVCVTKRCAKCRKPGHDRRTCGLHATLGLSMENL